MHKMDKEKRNKMIIKKRGLETRKVYKSKEDFSISNLRIVSMTPGNRKVAGCFNFSYNLIGGSNGRHFNLC